MKAFINKIGAYLPETQINNQFLAEKYATNKETIYQKTGILNRRYAALNEKTSDLAFKACHNLLQETNLDNFDFIEGIVLCTATPDTPIPGSVHLIQEKIKRIGIPVYELRGASGDFLKALELGTLLIEQKKMSDLLVIGADTPSKYQDGNNFDTDILFGDGAAAVHLTNHSNHANLKIIDYSFGADGRGVPSLYLEKNLMMNGKVVMLEAITRIKQIVEALLKKQQLTTLQIDHFVFHQANLRLLEFVAKTMSLTEKQVFNNIEHVGNTSSASIPLCLHDLIQTKTIMPGEKIVLAGFASGFSYGACLIEAC